MYREEETCTTELQLKWMGQALQVGVADMYISCVPGWL